MLGGDFVGEKELSVSHLLFGLLLSVCLSFCPVVSFASGVEAKSSGLPSSLAIVTSLQEEAIVSVLFLFVHQKRSFTSLC